ncbi:S41 family peptidase [Brucella ciceri]|nr:MULTISPECIES: S41 family peptidase [Brucella]MCH6203135.1 S41 family peptidase [Brucella ciceri]UXO83541.1 S41 family peptidase [Brucella intermedia]
MTAFRHALIVFAFLANMSPAFAADVPDDISIRRETIDTICSILRTEFFDPEMAGLDWDKMCQEAHVKVGIVKDDEQFRAIAASLPAALKTSHTAYYAPKDPDFAILYSVYGKLERFKEVTARHGGLPLLRGAGIFAKNVDGRVFIDNILDGSPAEKAGLKEGDELVEPSQAVFAARWPDDKTEAEAKTAIVHFRRTPGGPIESRTVDLLSGDALQMLSTATEKSVRIIERGGVKIGYLRGWTMLTRAETGGPAEVLRSALNGEFADVSAVVFDARGRIGGGGIDILETYFGPRVVMSSKGQKNEQWLDHPVMPAGKPLIIIIDQHTRSAAEVMSYVAKRDKLALLVGSRTAGAVAGGSLFPLPDGGGLYVAVQALRTDGHVLEGQGVVPDVIVERSLPYAGGADPQLDRALEEAEKKARER